jgi:predicted RNase H-like HicB family nuclease
VHVHHYVAVLVPLQIGGWRAYFPDLIGCGREGDDADAALESATQAAKDWLAQPPNKQVVPLPRNIDQIRADKGWADQRLVNWSKAIIRTVQL